MAWLVVDPTWRCQITIVPGSIFPTTLYREKTIFILHFAIADSGNRTRAPYAVSECAFHYAIASRLPLNQVDFTE